MELATDITIYAMLAVVTAIGAVSFRRAMNEAQETVKVSAK